MEGGNLPMNFYDQVIYPRLMQASLSTPAVTARRKQLLAKVQGVILEIGFGTGLNLPCYPAHIAQIAVAEPNTQMPALAAKRVQESKITVDFRPIRAEKLPFADQTFDSVVSTFTLCSIPDVAAAVGEVWRVLKPDGRVFFLEHGLSPDPSVRRWQTWLTPFYRFFAGGCHLDRDMAGILAQGRFTIQELERTYLPGEIKISGYTYQGIATPNQMDGNKV
jgi:ubiquinone/menaquinone biosynthesis C-methylase UbiE